MAEYSNPVFMAADGSAIDITDEHGHAITVAASDAPTAALYTLAMEGAFGAVAPYAPPAITKGQLSLRAQTALDRCLSAGIIVNVAAVGTPAVNVLCDGSSATIASLGMLRAFGAANPSGARTWVDNNGVATRLTGAELVTLDTRIEAWVSRVYELYGQLAAEIAAGSITTPAQVDATPWPIA